MALVGVAGGLALGLLQYTIGRCLHYGPAGLSFIFVSSACVIPPIIMFFIFGAEFGHGFTLYNLFGFCVVLLGLYWMGKSQGDNEVVDFKKWSLWVGLAFASGILHQLILQWRALLLKENMPDSCLLPFHCSQAEGEIYIVIAFLVASLCQMLFQSGSEKVHATGKQVLVCGILGGILNGLSCFLLIQGTEYAVSDLEKAIIFPLNTVLLITLCNSWAKALYKEKVNWPANFVCVSGIIAGSK